MKRKISVILGLLLIACLLFGCGGPQENTLTVEEATDLMASESFDLGENPEVPLALLGVSEDAVKEDSRYTRSMEGSEYYDEEYVYEWSEDEEISLAIIDGKIQKVWLYYTSFDQPVEKVAESTQEYAEVVHELDSRYFFDDELNLQDISVADTDLMTVLEEGYSCMLTWDEKEEDSQFYISTSRTYNPMIQMDSTSYCISL